MHPDRGVVRTYIRSESLATIPDGPNTLPLQSDAANDAPRDHLHRTRYTL